MSAISSKTPALGSRRAHLGSLELPQGNVDGDTTLTLGLQLVQNPGVLEGTLAELSGFL